MIHEWNTAPPLDLPLPKHWPKFTALTSQMLVVWGMQQPKVRPWVMLRTAQYWEAGQRRLETVFDAWACLEALQWQTGLGPREAVEWLKGLIGAGDVSKPVNQSLTCPADAPALPMKKEK